MMMTTIKTLLVIYNQMNVTCHSSKFLLTMTNINTYMNVSCGICLAEVAKLSLHLQKYNCARHSRNILSGDKEEDVKPGETKLFSKHFSCLASTYSCSAVYNNRWTTWRRFHKTILRFKLVRGQPHCRLDVINCRQSQHPF